MAANIYGRSGTVSTQPLGEYRGPKPAYWVRSSGYRKIVKSNEEPILLAKAIELEIDAIKAEIVRNSPVAKVMRILLHGYVALATVIFLYALNVLIFDKKINSVLIGVVGCGLYFPLIWLYSLLCEKYKRLQDRLFIKRGSKFKDLQSALDIAKIHSKSAELNILKAWDDYCVNYDKYPPDWDERKDIVKKRDGFKCTICGWPTGYKVMRRNLHVHHILSLPMGGDNSLENLTTLCHVCHRQQEGKGHRRIKYRKQSEK